MNIFNNPALLYLCWVKRKNKNKQIESIPKKY